VDFDVSLHYKTPLEKETSLKENKFYCNKFTQAHTALWDISLV
jgi:hypothetical protein